MGALPESFQDVRPCKMGAEYKKNMLFILKDNKATDEYIDGMLEVSIKFMDFLASDRLTEKKSIHNSAYNLYEKMG